MTAGPIDWIDQRLNAVLVKDVRAWLRSKKFLVVFFAALVLIQVVTVVVAVLPSPDSGSILFLILCSGLGAILAGVLPFLVQDRFTDELSSGSTDLALISRMTPGQLVRGKIMSGVAASMLFFSAAAPSFTIAYMLGGVDLVMLLYMVGLILFASVVSMILAILIVSIAGKRRLRFLGLVPIGVGVGFCILVVALTEMVAKEALHLEPAFWLVHAVILAYVGLLVLFLYAVAVSRLSFEADNRDSRPRLALCALTVVPIVIAAVVAKVGSLLAPSFTDPDDFLVAFIVVGLCVFAFGSFFVLTTPDRPSARVRSRASRLGLVRLLLYPGPGRLYAYLLVHFAFFGAASILPEILFGVDGEVTLGLLAASLVAMPTILGGCTLAHAVVARTGIVRRRLPRGLFAVVLAVVWAGAAVPLGVLVDALDLDEFFLVFHPLTAIAYVADEEHLVSLALAILANGLVLVPAMIYWLFEIAKACVEEARLSAELRRGKAG